MASINEYGDSVHAVAIMWLDKNHQFFVGNAEPTTSEDPLYRVRWRQVTEQSDNLDPELVETVLKTPVTTESYYSAYVAIYRHTNQCQDDLKIERNLRTKDCWKRVNTSIFGVILVDAMNVHQACAGLEYIEDDPNEWFTDLAHEMINNGVKEHRRRSSNTGQPSTVEATPTLIPSKKMRKLITTN